MAETNQPSPLFRVVGQEPDTTQTPQEHVVATRMLIMALTALGQRFVVALHGMFTLLTVISCFVLWLIIPDPNNKQLISMGMYAAFVLFINLLTIWGRRK